jgi:tRNA pseudouridine55 synthase
VAIVRRALQVRRAGHTGTLDPFASGLLVVLVGRATRLARYLVDLTKSYTGTIKLGETTDTCDLTGEVIGGTDGWKDISDDRIADAMLAMTGTVSQVPPSYSAKKIGGERAYRLARRGELVELEPREVQVQRFEMLEREGALVGFASEVSSGTYIRGLARDLGEILGCGAHLTALRRKSVGRFTVDDATLLDAVDAATELRPPLEAVSHLPIVKIDEKLRNAVRCGRPIESSLETGESVALVAGDTLVAVAQSEAELLKPRVVLEG